MPEVVRRLTSKLQIEIDDEQLGLPQSVVNALHRQQINCVYSLYADKYTISKIFDEIKIPNPAIVAFTVQIGLKNLSLPILSHDVASGEMYVFYKKETRHRLCAEVHEKAVEIMADVHWGLISPEKMSEELTYADRGYIVTVKDVKNIISSSLNLLRKAN